MKFFERFRSKQSVPMVIEQPSMNASQRKSLMAFSSLYESFMLGMSADLAAAVAISYSKRVAPVWHACELLAGECAVIKPVIKDRDDKDKVIDDHPLLDLINNPSAVEGGEAFLESLFMFYLMTGNTYFVATGAVSRPPLELLSIHPTRVNYTQNAIDGYVQQWRVDTIGRVEAFDRQDVKGRWSYVNQQADRELHQIKTFNPAYGVNNMFLGMSKLTPVFYEIEQYLLSSVHNAALLKNGATLSGLFSTEKDLTDEQFARLQMEVNNYFTGAKNAGRPMLAEGGITFESMMQNAKDMDFRNLKIDCRNMVYSIFKIPLPLVVSERMTMANMDSATWQLYDNAVIPLFTRVMGDLGDKLMPRYNLDPARYYLSYREQDIPAILKRKLDEVTELGSAGVLTVNEVRAKFGYGPVEGGDVIWIPMNMRAMDEDPADVNDGSEMNSDSNGGDDVADKPRKKPGTRGKKPAAQEGNSEGRGTSATRKPTDTDKRRAKQEFVEALQAKMNSEGQREYGDDEIETMVRDYGLGN